MEEKDGVQKLSKDERETVLIYNEAAGYWEIFTAVAKHMRKFDRLKYECTRTDYYENGEVYGKYYKIPSNAITFRDPTKKREMTEEERQAAAERLRALHRNKSVFHLQLIHMTESQLLELYLLATLLWITLYLI